MSAPASSTHRKYALTSGGLNVLVISPQRWSGFQVSKHHFANALAQVGNEVFFLEPPVLDRSMRPGEISIESCDSCRRIKVVRYCPWFYRLKFHARSIFNFLMRNQANRIQRACGKLDVVWDFDNTYNFSSLKPFHAELAIFHPVDQIVKHQSSSKDADIVFAVDESILKRVDTGSIPAYVIEHGLAPDYVSYAEHQLGHREVPNEAASVTRVGYVGNLLACAIDDETITSIVKQNCQIHFDFIGPYKDGTVSPGWINDLAALPNCKFHGFQTQQQILSLANTIDLWLICYDNSKDINGGVNSHKALEYLATGKPIVSSRLLAYQGKNLLNMPPEAGNENLPDLFSNVASSSPDIEESKRRMQFAIDRSYAIRLEEVTEHLRRDVLNISTKE
jgi:hypothetical protein